MHQSLKAVRMCGVVSMVGNVGKIAEEGALPITTSDIFGSLATVRSIGVGSKQSFLEMNKVIEARNIKPVLDKTIFEFEDMKAAYQYMVRTL
jgi:D-arabinose 1-dehydrogenase-like Zn-dependent alcohol dehydrogenase